jgi:hypothetical protein
MLLPGNISRVKYMPVEFTQVTSSLTLKGYNIPFFMHDYSEARFIIAEYVMGTKVVGPDSAVCIATCYGLDCLGIESR